MLPNNPTDNRLETNKPTLQKIQGGSGQDQGLCRVFAGCSGAFHSKVAGVPHS